MKKKIIIIGKKSFVGSNLFSFFKKKKIYVKLFDFNEFISTNPSVIEKFDYIINCSINKRYVKKKYNEKNDHDYKIAKKILNLNCNQIFLSSRRVYKPSNNISERAKLHPSCTYSKNKVLTENKLLKILKERVLILRISNLVGLNLNFGKSRKIHDTFINIFLRNVKKNYIYENKKIYKDFLSIEKFSFIVEKLINSNAYGIYNVSIGKKIFLNKLILWLNYYNPNTVRVKKQLKKFNKDCFYLNNNRLKKKIDIKIQLNDLEKYCKKLSKKIFEKK
tara:strand:- start:8 stop:838 length:831 start_codon:yes stop_codon:yes gene_type:complete